MNYLIKNTMVVDKFSPFHNQRVDIEINEGLISNIGENLKNETSKIISGEDLHISPSWVDPRVNFCDPGFEHREDLQSGAKAAINGGIQHVGLMPFTQPTIESKTQINYIFRKQLEFQTQIHPFAPIFKSNSKLELTEMADLFEAGAIGFVQQPETKVTKDSLIKALNYTKTLPVSLLLEANDLTLFPEAFINEGRVNVTLGALGHSAEIEELTTYTIIKLAAYCNKPIHIMGVSSIKSLELIKQAKEQSLPITCDTSVYNLLFTDAALADFDTMFKLNPILRTEEDKNALIEAVLDGTIDAVVSNHSPFEEDLKKCEPALASFGVIGVQTLFPLLMNALDSLGDVIDVLSFRNRKLLGLPDSCIKIGEKVDFTVFSPEMAWKFNAANNFSKSCNSMVFDSQLTGKAVFCAFEKSAVEL